MAAQSHDKIIPVVDMKFIGLDNIDVAGWEVRVLLSAQRLFVNRLWVPYSYSTLGVNYANFAGYHPG